MLKTNKRESALCSSMFYRNPIYIHQYNLHKFVNHFCELSALNILKSILFLFLSIQNKPVWNECGFYNKGTMVLHNRKSEKKVSLKSNQVLLAHRAYLCYRYLGWQAARLQVHY